MFAPTLDELNTYPTFHIAPYAEDDDSFPSASLNTLGSTSIVNVSITFVAPAYLADAFQLFFDERQKDFPDATPETLFTRSALEDLQYEINRANATGITPPYTLAYIDIINAIAVLGTYGDDYQYKLEVGPHPTDKGLAYVRISIA
ncbi:MAG: hypothetical protein ACKO0Z_07085 [Betaproteobacteria bacterium]